MQNIFKAVPRQFLRSPRTFNNNIWNNSFSKYMMSTVQPATTSSPETIEKKPKQLHPAFKVRQMTLEDFKTVIGWANNESWFISEDDAEVYYQVDPRGLFVGEIHGEPICSYIGFKYGDYHFLTFHITKTEYQGIGYGKKIEEETRHFYKDAKVIFFDAAGDGIRKYTQLGYNKFCEILTCRKKAEGKMGPNTVDLRTVPLRDLMEYDLSVFGYPREKLLAAILERKNYQALGVVRDGKLKGFGILRKCQNDVGYALSPIYADDKEAAEEIFNGLQSFVVGKDVYVEAYDCNPHCVQILEEQGWTPLFSCIRMHGGQDQPKLDKSRLYSDFCF